MTGRAQAPVATAPLLTTAVSALRASARRHKTAVAHHRRAAQADMVAADRLAEACRQLGIRFDTVTAQEAQTHDD